MATGDEMRPASSKFTYEDFLNFPDDGRRHEIIDGEHYVTPSPNTGHQTIAGNLHVALRRHLETHPAGAIFLAPLDVLLSDLNVVEPDLLYVARERQGVVTEAPIEGSPDLVVEILSPATRRVDEITKRKLYEQFEVREYWVVDSELETVKVYRRGQHGFDRSEDLALEHGGSHDATSARTRYSARSCICPAVRRLTGMPRSARVAHSLRSFALSPGVSPRWTPYTLTKASPGFA